MELTRDPLFLELVQAPARRLESLLAGSAAPALETLSGYEFRGWNTPWYCSALGIRKFIKGFCGAEGYNIPARQNGLHGDWLHKPSAETPKRFGFYALGRGPLHPQALLLDYGANPRNPGLAPERLLRDYLVQPDPARPDVLLGKAYLALGGHVPVSYFVLERLRPTNWRPA